MADETPKSDEVKSATPADVEVSLADAKLSELMSTLIDEIRALRAELRGRVAGIAGDAANADEKKELKRRAETLANRAENGPYGKVICIFCGKGIAYRIGLRNHLRKCHFEQVMEINPLSFE